MLLWIAKGLYAIASPFLQGRSFVLCACSFTNGFLLCSTLSCKALIVTLRYIVTLLSSTQPVSLLSTHAFMHKPRNTRTMQCMSSSALAIEQAEKKAIITSIAASIA
jgi:hypothetical protein